MVPPSSPRGPMFSKLCSPNQVTGGGCRTDSVSALLLVLHLLEVCFLSVVQSIGVVVLNCNSGYICSPDCFVWLFYTRSSALSSITEWSICCWVVGRGDKWSRLCSLPRSVQTFSITKPNEPQDRIKHWGRVETQRCVLQCLWVGWHFVIGVGGGVPLLESIYGTQTFSITKPNEASYSDLQWATQ